MTESNSTNQSQSQSQSQSQQENLPFIIAGAGPCGLVAAITLQQEGEPFLILERASRERLCSNVGSGFDLAPTAINILKHRLNIKGILTNNDNDNDDGDGDNNNTTSSSGFQRYGGMYLCDMDGKEIRECSMSDMVAGVKQENYEALAANRAAMQECFLNHLLKKEQEKQIAKKEKTSTDDENNDSSLEAAAEALLDESSFLQCGVGVVGYEEDDDNDAVIVELSNGKKVTGRALLGCDGIHSAVRRCMMESFLSLPTTKGEAAAAVVKDDLHSCDITCWWGKIDAIQEDSEFAKLLETTQKRKEEGSSFIWALGDSKRPGGFMGAPAGGDTFMWAFFAKQSKNDNDNGLPQKNHSDDLTRRGGLKLDEQSKKDLLNIVRDRGELIHLAIRDTPACNITKVDLYDRENLNLPYSKGRVALLGDSAHPQSPFMGQGVNQAITDAYVCSMRLARRRQSTNSTSNGSSSTNSAIREALCQYDTNERRKAVNTVIQKARDYGNYSVSENRFVCWLFYIVAGYMPLSWLWADMLDGDLPNADFVRRLDQDLLKAQT